MALLIYASTLVFPAILVLVVFTVWLYWRGVRPTSFGLAVPSRLEVFRMIGIGIALACFSGGIRVVMICAVSTMAPDLLGPWFFRGLPNELIVFRPPPIDAVVLRGVSIVLVAPLLEELVFRGFAFRTWKKSWGFLRAALASSTVFAVFHYDTAFIGPLVFALVACKVYQETGNLVSPLLVHCTHNLMSMIAGLAFLASGASTIHDAARLSWDLLPVGVAGLGAGGGIALWIFVSEGVRNSKRGNSCRFDDPFR